MSVFILRQNNSLLVVAFTAILREQVEAYMLEYNLTLSCDIYRVLQLRVTEIVSTAFASRHVSIRYLRVPSETRTTSRF
jgi:hypothetical protein